MANLKIDNLNVTSSEIQGLDNISKLKIHDLPATVFQLRELADDEAGNIVGGGGSSLHKMSQLAGQTCAGDGENDPIP